MTDSARLPGSHYWPGLPTPFWQWFRQVDAAIGSGAAATVDLAALTARVETLENAESESLTVTLSGPQSVRVDGALATGATVRLVGDVSTPGATFYYGTDASGDKGWHDLSAVTSAPVPTLIASGDTYTVAADTQVLWADDIDIEGTLDVSGSFIEVN